MSVSRDRIDLLLIPILIYSGPYFTLFSLLFTFWIQTYVIFGGRRRKGDILCPSADGKYVVISNENQRHMDLVDGAPPRLCT